MPKLSLADLAKIKDKVRKDNALREGGATAKVIVHMGTCGIAAGARQVMDALLTALAESGRSDVIVTSSGCVGLCSREPLVTVIRLGEEPIRYAEVDAAVMRQIFQRHVMKGEIQDEFVLARGSEHSD